MKTLCWLGLMLALAAGGATGQERVDRQWPFAPTGSLRIANPFGVTRVIGWDADSVAVTGSVGAGAGRFYAGGNGQVLKLGVEAPLDQPTPGRAELEIRVPRRATVWVKSAGADIDVVGMDGFLDLNAVSGAIRVTGSPQDVSAESMSGTVEIVGGTGRARVKTVSGAVLLRGASEDLGASTLSGSIVVRAAGWQRGGAGVQRGKFESVTGDIRFEGELGRGGVLEIESQSGKVDVRVPASTPADFDLVSIGGDIHNTLGSAQPTMRPEGRGQELHFSTGAAGAQVTVRSYKGSVVLGPR